MSFLVLLGSVVLFLPQSLHRLLAPPDLLLLTLREVTSSLKTVLFPTSQILLSDRQSAGSRQSTRLRYTHRRVSGLPKESVSFTITKNHKIAHFYSCAFVSFSHSRQKTLASVIIANYALDVNKSSLMK